VPESDRPSVSATTFPREEKGKTPGRVPSSEETKGKKIYLEGEKGGKFEKTDGQESRGEPTLQYLSRP